MCFFYNPKLLRWTYYDVRFTEHGFNANNAWLDSVYGYDQIVEIHNGQEKVVEYACYVVGRECYTLVCPD